MFEFLTGSTVNLLIATITTFIGVMIQAFFIFKSKKKEEEKSRKQIAEISEALKSEQEVRKVVALEKTVEKIPTGLSKEQLEEIVSKINLNQDALPPSLNLSAVENLINSYHEQALSQAKVQFWFSVVAASVGFFLIVGSWFNIQDNFISSLMKTLPGTVMDSVAFLFFRQAAETRQRATDLYDRLRRDKQITESLTLVSSIEDEEIRSVVKAQIALHMAGLQQNPIDLSSLLIKLQRI
jgi:hypothetical protein